jgi:hypothetical protein
MGMVPRQLPQCPYCTERHGPRHMCDAISMMLEAMAKRASDLGVTPQELPRDDIEAGMGEGTVLIRQLLIEAAVTEVLGVKRPVLIFSGQDSAGSELPRWLYPAENETAVRRAVLMFSDVAEMAIEAAR